MLLMAQAFLVITVCLVLGVISMLLHPTLFNTTTKHLSLMSGIPTNSEVACHLGPLRSMFLLVCKDHGEHPTQSVSAAVVDTLFERFCKDQESSSKLLIFYLGPSGVFEELHPPGVSGMTWINYDSSLHDKIQNWNCCRLLKSNWILLTLVFSPSVKGSEQTGDNISEIRSEVSPQEVINTSAASNCPSTC